MHWYLKTLTIFIDYIMMGCWNINMSRAESDQRDVTFKNLFL